MPIQGPEVQAQRKLEIADMRARILVSARAVARSEGWSAVSIRAVAKGLGCSAPLLYTYFKDKQEMLSELQRQVLRELGARLQGQNSLEEMTLNFFDFAVAQPELFQLMTGQVEGSNMPGPDEIAEACRPVLEHFGQHPVPGLGTEEAFIRWWSLVFGFLLSAIDGMTGGIEESRELLARIWR